MKREKEIKKSNGRKQKETQDTRKTMQDPGHHRKGLRDVLVQCSPNNNDNNKS